MHRWPWAKAITPFRSAHAPNHRAHLSANIIPAGRRNVSAAGDIRRFMTSNVKQRRGGRQAIAEMTGKHAPSIAIDLWQTGKAYGQSENGIRVATAAAAKCRRATPPGSRCRRAARGRPCGREIEAFAPRPRGAISMIASPGNAIPTWPREKLYQGRSMPIGRAVAAQSAPASATAAAATAQDTRNWQIVILPRMKSKVIKHISTGGNHLRQPLHQYNATRPPAQEQNNI